MNGNTFTLSLEDYERRVEQEVVRWCAEHGLKCTRLEDVGQFSPLMHFKIAGTEAQVDELRAHILKWMDAQEGKG